MNANQESLADNQEDVRAVVQAKITDIIRQLKRDPWAYNYRRALAEFIEANPNAAEFIRQAWKDVLRNE